MSSIVRKNHGIVVIISFFHYDFYLRFIANYSVYSFTATSVKEQTISNNVPTRVSFCVRRKDHEYMHSICTFYLHKF